MIRHQAQAGQKSQPEIEHAPDSQKASPLSVTPETNGKTPKVDLATENINGCKEPAMAEVPADSSPDNGVPVSR